VGALIGQCSHSQKAAHWDCLQSDAKKIAQLARDYRLIAVIAPVKACDFRLRHSFGACRPVQRKNQKHLSRFGQSTFVPRPVHTFRAGIAAISPRSSKEVLATERVGLGLVSSVYGEEYFIASLAHTGL